jgi:CRISPR-associated endoribonuclease Cas6
MLPISHGAYAYASALDILLRLDPALAQELHEDSPNKPITMSPLTGPFQREGANFQLNPDISCFWRLTGLNARVSELLFQISPSLGGIRIANTVLTITQVFTSSEEHPEAGRDGYADLLARWAQEEPGNSITLRFITPTTFRAGRYEQPFPLPGLVFGSLLNKWNANSPVPLSDCKDFLSENVVLGNWKGETRRVELGARRTVGFIGKFTYHVLKPTPDVCRLLHVLSEFAFYSGVGWQTAHGMGQTRLD